MSAVPFAAFVLFLLPTVLPTVDGSNVLVFMPMPLKSHVFGFQPMFEELARRGHNVTVVSSFPLTDRRVANYTDVDVSPPNFPDFNVMRFVNQNFVTSVLDRWMFAGRLANVLEHPNMKEFIRSESNSFDLVLVETFYQEYTVAIGHKFNAPVVNLSPLMVWASSSKWLHVPSTFSYVPDCCAGLTDEMGFVDRLKNTVTGVLEMYVENYLYIPKMKRIMDKYFTYKGWETRPSLERMLNNVPLTLMNAHHVVGVCRPYLPGVIEVGGMHIKEPKPLPQDLQDYIDSAVDGVVYFSFGSLVNLSHLPEKKLSDLLSVIGRLKQRVIIKWAPDKSVKLPPNVKIGSWWPQKDILAHPNVKLFITHGGLHSIEEAVYNSKPVVGIPFFGDQLSNLRIVEKNGYGKLITFSDLTEDTFEASVKEVLSNPKFKETVIIRSRMYRDQSMKPIDRAIYWIEYVIRNNGAKHLISDSIGLNEPQFFLFDIALVLLVPIGSITFLCYRGMSKISSNFR